MTVHKKPLVYPSFESGQTKFDAHGREIPDRRPLELLLTLQKAVQTNEMKLKEMVTRELNKLAASRGFETIDEANDFELGDEDSAALSGYEFSEELSYMDKTPPAASAASSAADPAASTPSSGEGE